MRYVIKLEDNYESSDVFLSLHKVKASKNNSPLHYKTKRVALKHLNKLSKNFGQFED
jgi:hypothetical protein